jgi:hypothetical protein
MTLPSFRMKTKRSKLLQPPLICPIWANAPMIQDIEDGMDLETNEMELDGIDLQSIVDAIHRQDMQSIPPNHISASKEMPCIKGEGRPQTLRKMQFQILISTSNPTSSNPRKFLKKTNEEAGNPTFSSCGKLVTSWSTRARMP